MSEPGLAALLETLRPAQIAAEAGVGSAADTGALAALRPSVRWLRILLEVSGVPAARAVTVADEILRGLDQLGLAVPRLLHGEEDSCWPLVSRGSGYLSASRATCCWRYRRSGRLVLSCAARW